MVVLGLRSPWSRVAWVSDRKISFRHDDLCSYAKSTDYLGVATPAGASLGEAKAFQTGWRRRL